MKTRTFIFISIIFLFVLAILLVVYFLYVPLFFSNSNEETNRLKEQVKTLQEENTTLKAEAEADAKKEKALEASLSSAQKEADKVPELEQKLATFEKKAKKLSKQDQDNLDLLYPYMDFKYEIRDLTKFYSDPSCEERFLINKDLIWVGWVDHAYPYFDNPTDGTYSTYYSSKVFDYDNDGKDDYVYSKTQPILFAIK